MIAYAQGAEAAARSVLERLNDAILFPLITLMMSVAVLVFLWGGFEYIAKADNDTAREEGRRHMFWGIIGLVVMLSAYAILSIAAGTVGISV